MPFGLGFKMRTASAAQSIKTPSVAQHNFNVGGFTNIAFSGNQTAGNLNIFVNCDYTSTAYTVTAVNDTAGNTYVLGAQLVHPSSTEFQVAVYYCASIKAHTGTNTVTPSISGGSFTSNASMFCVELAGGTWTFDRGATQYTASTANPPISITTAAANEVLIHVIQALAVGGTVTHDATCTQIDNTGTSTNTPALDEYKQVGAAGSYTITPTISAADNSLQAVLAFQLT